MPEGNVVKAFGVRYTKEGAKFWQDLILLPEGYNTIMKIRLQRPVHAGRVLAALTIAISAAFITAGVQAAPTAGLPNGIVAGRAGLGPGLPILPGFGNAAVSGPFLDAFGNPYLMVMVGSDPVHNLLYVERIPIAPNGAYGRPQPGVIYAPAGQPPVSYNVPPGGPAYGMPIPYGNPYLNPYAGPPGAWNGYGQFNGALDGNGNPMNPNGYGMGQPGQQFQGDGTIQPLGPTQPGQPNSPAETGVPPVLPPQGQGESGNLVGAQRAIIDLQEAWSTGQLPLLVEHLVASRPVQLYYNGKPDRTVSGDEYLQLARKAITGMSTQSFLLDHRTLLPDGRVEAWGKHTFYDETGVRRTTFACFWLQRVGDRWIVTAVNSATSSKNIQVAAEPAG